MFAKGTLYRHWLHHIINITILIPYFAFIFSGHTTEITITADKPNEAPTESPNTKPPITNIFCKNGAPTIRANVLLKSPPSKITGVKI